MRTGGEQFRERFGAQVRVFLVGVNDSNKKEVISGDPHRSIDKDRKWVYVSFEGTEVD